MQGQASPLGTITTIIFVAVFVIIGALVYAYVADVTPHDTLIINESLCTTACVSQAEYAVDYPPYLNDTTLNCYNETSTLARGGSFNTVNNRDVINLSFPDSTGSYSYVNCTYTYDWATTDEQTFWTSNVSNTGAGLTLLAVIVIVLASVAVITIVLLLRTAA